MTAVSSSSSELERAPEALPDDGDAAAPAPEEGRVIVDVRGLGVWFRLMGSDRTRSTLREFVQSVGGMREGRRLWALRDVDLQCREGQVLGIVGHNGAGKSTLCLALARILEPDEGTIRVDGEVSTLLTLGAGFRANLSGRDNIELYSAFLGIEPEDLAARMDDIIAFSELGEFIDEPVAHYSSGMRARLAFSVASTIEPEILVLDEVLGVGDRAFRAKSKKRIRAMMKRSRLIIVVSHAIDYLRDVCTHGLWLEHGRVREYGPAGAVLDAYEARPVDDGEETDEGSGS